MDSFMVKLEKNPTFSRYVKILWWWSSGHVAGTVLENASWTLKVSCLASSKKILCSLFTHNYKNAWHIFLINLKFDTYCSFPLSLEVWISLYGLNNISLVAHRCKTHTACIMFEMETMRTIMEQVFPRPILVHNRKYF